MFVEQLLFNSKVPLNTVSITGDAFVPTLKPTFESFVKKFMCAPLYSFRTTFNSVSVYFCECLFFYNNSSFQLQVINGFQVEVGTSVHARYFSYMIRDLSSALAQMERLLLRLYWISPLYWERVPLQTYRIRTTYVN